MSKDLNSTVLLIGLFAYLGLGRYFIYEKLQEIFALPLQYLNVPFEQAVSEVISGIFINIAILTMPALLIVIVLSIATSMIQTGPIMAFESLKPDLNKLNPITKFKNIFAMKNFIELLKSTIKIIFLSILIYMLIKSVLDPLMKVPFIGFYGLLVIMGPILKKFIYYVAFAYIVVAVIDFIFQQYNHIKELMMSKDEVKREYKEMEGDPHIKGKRKQLHRELINSDPSAAVKKSSVLVTNPTHYAIAILYDGGIQTKLPVVLSKGTGAMAEQMIKVAEENNIPIMRNVPLAHALWDMAEVMQYIPSDLIEPVAEVLAWVNDMKQREGSVHNDL